MLISFRNDGCDRAKAEYIIIDSLDDIDLEALGETYAAVKRRLIAAAMDEVFPAQA
jgi:hypothetical protein